VKEFHDNLYGVDIVGPAKNRKCFNRKISRMRAEAFSFNEYIQPSMLKISNLVYDMTPCQSISHIMSMRSGNVVGLNAQLKEMLDGVNSWLSENRAHLEIFARFVNGLKIINIDQCTIGIDGLLHINLEDEQRYLDNADDEEEKRMRLKILAAIGVIIQNEYLKSSTESNDAAAVGWHMFFLFRSFVQFASCATHRRGLSHSQRSKKGGEATKSREGYFALIKRVCPSLLDENISALIAWKRVISMLRNKKRAISCNGSKFYIEEDEANAGFEHVALREVRNGHSYIPIKFHTFRSIYGQVKKAFQQMKK